MLVCCNMKKYSVKINGLINSLKHSTSSTTSPTLLQGLKSKERNRRSLYPSRDQAIGRGNAKYKSFAVLWFNHLTFVYFGHTVIILFFYFVVVEYVFEPDCLLLFRRVNVAGLLLLIINALLSLGQHNVLLTFAQVANPVGIDLENHPEQAWPLSLLISLCHVNRKLQTTTPSPCPNLLIVPEMQLNPFSSFLHTPFFNMLKADQTNKH